MKLSIYMAALLAITCNMHCADDINTTIQTSVSSAWTQNPQLADTIAYNIGADHNLCAYYEQSSEYTTHAWQTNADKFFGFAFVPSAGTTEPLQVSKEIFLAACKEKTNYFHIKESTSLHTPGRITSIGAYAYANPARPYQFLLLCSNRDLQHQMTTELNASIEPSTLAAAAQILRTRMPDTTFVLFDTIAYNTIVLGLARPDFSLKPIFSFSKSC